jgi:alpha-beta hydrolase superfamily lysophospholipase
VAAVRSGARAGDVPLLLIHAEDDETCPISHAHAIHAAAVVEDKELVVVQRCQHVGCFFRDRSAYMKLVVGFFDRVFERAEAEGRLAEGQAEEQEILVDKQSGFVKITRGAR